MLGSTLIDAVNEIMEETQRLIEEEMNPDRLAACVEIRGMTRDGKGRMKCGFAYTTMIALGKASSNDMFRDYLQKNLHEAHSHLLIEKGYPQMSWESSPFIYASTKRSYEDENRDYSIAAGAIGGTREENQTVVNTIINSIP